MKRLDTFRHDPFFNRILRNTAYLFSSNTINLVLSIVQSSFAAHLLGVRDYGILGTITVFASTINRLLSFRMSELVVKYMGSFLAENRPDRAAALVKAAALVEAISSIIAFALLLMLSPLAALYLADNAQLTVWFNLYGLIILGNLVTETSTGVLQVNNHFRGQAVVNVVQGAVTAAIIIIAYMTSAGLPLVVAAYLIGKIILGGGPIILAWRSLNQTLGKGWWRAPFYLLPPWRELVHFGIGTNLSATVNLLVRDSELLWVAFFLSPVEAGYYKVALAINNLVLMPITPFISTTYPEINRSIAERSWSRLRRILRRVTLLSGGWTLLAAVGLALLGPFVITIYAGAEFIPAYPAMLVLLVGFGLANIFFWNRALLLAYNLPDFALGAIFWSGMVKVLPAFVLVPRYGYVAEAGLLSLYFVISVGVIVWRGLVELSRSQAAHPTEGVA